MHEGIETNNEVAVNAVPAEPRATRNELAPEAPAEPRVEEISDRTAFVALEREWNALVAACDDQVFYRHEFIRVWLDNFAPNARWRILTLRGESGALEAVLPLVERWTSMYGVPVRELSSASNLHSCRFDLVAKDPAAAASSFASHLLSSRWEVLRFTDVPEGGKAYALLEELRARGCPTGTWESLRSPYVPLPTTHAELLARLDGKFKANVRRRRKRLDEKGRVTLERVEGGPELARYLEEGFALEKSGWKGKGGTAIAQDEATRGFYSELARTAAGTGSLALWFMRLDGRAVGFHFALEHAGRYLLLKPAYDEALKECSPGQLLMDEVLKACVERGLPEFDFLGPDMVWKRDWTDKVRPHHWLFIFRNDLKGRALREAKFTWVPAAKEIVTRWKR